MSAVELMRAPTLTGVGRLGCNFNGFVGRRWRAAIEGWLLPAARANPSILQMFRDRDRRPRRDLVPWAGEFAGKHLTAVALILRAQTERALEKAAADFIRALITAQDEDGYLGPHPNSERLVGKSVKGDALWDVWGHYHCLVGLLLSHGQRWAPPEALTAARRIGDLICRTFLETGTPLTVAGAEEMNMAIAHGMALLYRATGEPRYLQMALRVVKDWEIPPAGDYLRVALEGREFHECPKPRWESLHDLLVLPELYYITGEEPYRRAFEHYWWSIFRSDRHNTGGFTSGEQATGNPYDPRAIETCCTVAWIVMSVEMLKLTGDPRVADELELSTFNASLGGQHPSGRWWTYNTPMDGVKLASAHEIVFQSHAGGPELNCCSVNAPRGPAMLVEWALMQSPAGFLLNYYGPTALETDLPSGNHLTLRQRTTYPKSGAVTITLRLDRPETFTLALRIPRWSARTTAAVNHEPVEGIKPGTYLRLSRDWNDGDTVRLGLDMRFHFWVGEREQAGKVSLYRGPILLAYDPFFNAMDPDDVPAMAASDLQAKPVRWDGWPNPWLLLSFEAEEGQELRLCDFASAGASGNPYRSWLPITGLTPPTLGPQDAAWCYRPPD